MDRVIITTGLRIQAHHMVNAQAFTYSKGYLGLLSTLGVSLGIILCCAPVVPFLYRRYQPLFLRFAHSIELGSTYTQIDNKHSIPASIPRVLCRNSPGSYDKCTVPRLKVFARSNELGPTYTQIYNTPSGPPSIPKVLCRNSPGPYD